MTNEPYLFIGGTHDGERIALPHPMAYYKMSGKRPPFNMRDTETAKNDGAVMIDTYRRACLTDGDGGFAYVYLYEMLTATEMVRALIAKYHP